MATVVQTPILQSALQGAAKGFALYFVPMTIVKRGVRADVVKRAASIAAFAATVRIAYRLLYQRRANANKAATSTSSSSKTAPTTSTTTTTTTDTSVQQRLWTTFAQFFDSPEAMAGAIGTLAAVSVDNSLANSVFVFWMFIRTVRHSLPDRILSIPHLDTVCMCLASAQIMSTWIGRRNEIDPMYASFLDQHGDVKKHVLAAIVNKPTACEVVHPGQSCPSFLANFALRSYPRSLKLYAIQYLILFFFSKRKDPVAMGKSLLRSALFLTTYCTIAWFTACYAYKIFPTVTRRKLFAHMWLTGLSVLIERKSRRAELAGYVSTYALDAMLSNLHRKGLPYVKGFATLTLMTCVAILLHHKEKEADFVTKWLLAIRNPSL